MYAFSTIRIFMRQLWRELQPDLCFFTIEALVWGSSLEPVRSLLDGVGGFEPRFGTFLGEGPGTTALAVGWGRRHWGLEMPWIRALVKSNFVRQVLCFYDQVGRLFRYPP